MKNIDMKEMKWNYYHIWSILWS